MHVEEPIRGLVCPHCGQSFAKCAAPGSKVRCRGCRQKFRVPKVREILAKRFAGSLARRSAVPFSSREELIEFVAHALLLGVKKKDLRDEMLKAGYHDLDFEELLWEARRIVRWQSRREGLLLTLFGVVMTVLIGGLIWLLVAIFGMRHLHGAEAVIIMGVIPLVIGPIKLVTGWNLMPRFGDVVGGTPLDVNQQEL